MPDRPTRVLLNQNASLHLFENLMGFLIAKREFNVIGPIMVNLILTPRRNVYLSLSYGDGDA